MSITNQEREARCKPVVHTGETLRVVNLVSEIRGLAASILIEAQLGQSVIEHERIGTPEQRAASTAALAKEIIGLAAALFPKS